MKAAVLIQRTGRLWAQCVLGHGLRYLHSRSRSFILTVDGAKHLRAVAQGPFLLVANHVLIRPENAPLGRFTQIRCLSLLNQPADSFVLCRVVAEETGLPLRVVAKSDRGWWSPRPLVRLLQKRIGQPFGKGLNQGLGYVPIEHNSGCFHRTFFQSVAEVVTQGAPVLIFPGKILCDNDLSRDGLMEGAVHPGAAHLARRFALPIVPAFIQGAESWQAGDVSHVTFGPAFSCVGMTKAEISLEIAEQVRALARMAPDLTEHTDTRAALSSLLPLV